MREDDIRYEHEREAWDAFNQANRRVPVVNPITGKVQWLKEWQARQAPSVGARARAILRNLLYPASYITCSELALARYLSDEQNADRRGFWRPRRSNAPQVLGGPRYFG